MTTRFDLQRRTFFRALIFSGAAFVLVPKALLRARAAAPSFHDVDPKEPIASALGYNRDATKVDVKKFPKKAGAEGKAQVCTSCMFYTPQGPKKGKCQIFSGNYVYSTGWCNSWAKKVAKV
jgi:hypothetical protein